ncbi:MAG: hypothetical protein COX30_00275 [Candidatus Moranbacteria bacterium CG23_combo_of_CG06-09_8_20_14_all_39_10]|nr:MAG: hypothetical protein COX30_00275 [Candidatus Moranbacteria bacterium CG23_combo_of_CG06-09_8_20_14_all_39_10]
MELLLRSSSNFFPRPACPVGRKLLKSAPPRFRPQFAVANCIPKPENSHSFQKEKNGARKIKKNVGKFQVLEFREIGTAESGGSLFVTIIFRIIFNF